MKQVQEQAADATVMALNRAIEAFCEAEAGMSSIGSARLLRLYGEDFAELSGLLCERGMATPARGGLAKDLPPLRQRGDG